MTSCESSVCVSVEFVQVTISFKYLWKQTLTLRIQLPKCQSLCRNRRRQRAIQARDTSELRRTQLELDARSLNDRPCSPCSQLLRCHFRFGGGAPSRADAEQCRARAELASAARVDWLFASSRQSLQTARLSYSNFAQSQSHKALQFHTDL